jgi:hypothetical protein
MTTLSWPTAIEGGDWSASRTGRSLPPEKTRYPLYRRLDRPQGRSGEVRKISPPRGFDPRTYQLVASRYTDYATRPTNIIVSLWISYRIIIVIDRNELFPVIWGEFTKLIRQGLLEECERLKVLYSETNRELGVGECGFCRHWHVSI